MDQSTVKKLEIKHLHWNQNKRIRETENIGLHKWAEKLEEIKIYTEGRDCEIRIEFT
jgi:hypothetical protein